MPPRRTLLDEAGTAWQLDRKFAEGGEGAVYTVVGQPALIAKLYTKPPSAQTLDKLRWMVRNSSPALQQVAAWPRALLTDAPGKPVVGFLMPFFRDYQPVQHLYNPAQRHKFFPRADWSFLVHAARNTAAAFEEVHKLGALVGDVNQSNVLVSPQAFAGLIDCDSFQMRADGKLYLCEVGVPHYTPPELQGKSFRGLERTPNQDRFGLAVLLFQLLYVGRHPYAGRYLGKGEPAFEQYIREFRFAYGPSAEQRQMARPPFTPDLTDVSPDLARLFERAFLPGSDAPESRPTATEWVRALDGFRPLLRACPNEPGHKMPAQAAGCPWCVIVAAGGPDYWLGVSAVAVVYAFDAGRLAALEGRAGRAFTIDLDYQRERLLPADPPVPVPAPENPPGFGLRSGLLTAGLIVGLVCMFGCIWSRPVGVIGLIMTGAFAVWRVNHVRTSPRFREYVRRRIVLHQLEHDLAAVEDQWRHESGKFGGEAGKARKRLDTALGKLRKLEPRYQEERRKLERDREKLAREEFLKNQFIADADIPKIGDGRKQILAAFNIETAFDIDEATILAIKGFGPGLTGNLVKWKKEVAASFKFDPSQGAPEADLRALAAKYQREQDGLFAEADKAVAELEAVAAKTAKRLAELEQPIRAAVGRWVQAALDVAVFHA